MRAERTVHCTESRTFEDYDELSNFPALSTDVGDTVVLVVHRDRDEPASPPDSRLRLLKQSSLAALPQETLHEIEKLLVPRTFCRGELLLEQSVVGRELHILAQGKVEIRLSTSERSLQLDQSSAGEIMGEMSLLTQAPCTADVIALEEVRTLSLSRENFRELTKLYPEVEIALGQVVSGRLGRQQFDALSGKVINGFLFQRCINRGGMGVVYEARTQRGHRIAIKMLRHRFIRNVEIIERFNREGQILAKLRHPNLLTVYDCFVAFNTRFLAMDYWDGHDLSHAIRHWSQKTGSGIPHSQALEILHKIASAVRYAHEKGVLHLDIKPANILVGNSGSVALSDFGLCQLIGVSEQRGVIVGTLPYMPPEQIKGESLCPESDYYALACTAYEILTGSRLFPQGSYPELLKAKSLLDASAIDARISDFRLRDFLRCALSPSPSGRAGALEILLNVDS